MNKKGQLTIFLILGIVVFTIFSLFFYTKAATSGLAVKLPPSFSEVDIYVTSCLKESVENITSPLEPIDELALDIGLDLIDPIKLKLSSCLDLSIFENYDVSGINNPELNIEINEKDISVFMYYKIIVTYKDLTKEFDSFYATVPITKVLYSTETGLHFFGA